MTLTLLKSAGELALGTHSSPGFSDGLLLTGPRNRRCVLLLTLTGGMSCPSAGASESDLRSFIVGSVVRGDTWAFIARGFPVLRPLLVLAAAALCA